MSTWSLYEKESELKPLVFSNSKSQDDVVREVLKEIDEGHKVIFIRGVCGTGKSAIALNLAKNIGKSSIIVPVKNLQEQYKEDYTNKKYLLKENGEKLIIKSITGRANHKCPFLEEEKQITKTEKNSVLDIFDEDGFIKMPQKSSVEKDISCNNNNIPCKIEIKNKNEYIIRKYLRKNSKINPSAFMNINNVKRISIAPICPYWSPIIPAELDISVLDNVSKKNYTGLMGKKYTIYQRKKGCGYYDQFSSYVNADVIIFNSQKYQLETLMNRKPATDIEIIDECDEFLDSFSNQKKINIDKFNFALGSLFSDSDKVDETIKRLTDLSFEILKDDEIGEHIINDKIIPVKDTKIFDLLREFLDSNFMSYVECDDENYCYHVEEIARIFEGFFDETYVSFYKEEKDLVVRLVTTNLEKRFKQLLDKNKVLVFMSGTIHSENVLKNIFGINNFKVIDAETQTPGQVTRVKTGYEVDCKYSNFQSGKVTRAQYLFALNRCLDKAKKPILVHVYAYSDLPTREEICKYDLKIISREDFISEQKNAENEVKKFKDGKIDILYSTKCNRGVDFPGEVCNSIILTKYPYPNINSIFWRILRKTRPDHYNAFYIDKARREFLQRVYRGLRSENDHIYLLSPDIRVLNASI
ncbi:MAG: helicase C-terminal domain-containing protein [archaeon]